MNKIGKIAIIAALVIIVTLIIIHKNKETKPSDALLETVEVETLKPHEFILKQTESVESEEVPVAKTEKAEEKKEKETVAAPITPKKTAGKKAEGDILALAQGETITKSELEKSFSELPLQHKDMFKNNKDGYLEQMIIKELLFQQAEKEGHTDSSIPKESQMDEAIQKLIGNISSDIKIAEAEMKAFYEENSGQMQGASFEQVKPNIEQYLMQQKQNEVIEEYVDTVRANADVALNEKWMAEQIALKPKNPYTEALKTGKPIVLALGADSCVPCMMMKPIVEELAIEYEGRAHILRLEISDYRDLATEFRVRVIPTQVFIDKNGEQYWRHEGFLSKEDIIKKLAEAGV